MTDFDKFLLWEAKSRDVIDFKKVYVDIAGDLISGLLLSQIIYWYLPDEHGKTKLRVQKDGQLWIAKGREDWWDEIRITPKQFDRASNILIEKGIITKGHFRFNGLRMVHIRLDYDQFMELWQAQLDAPAITQRGNPQLPKGETRNYPKGKPAIDLSVRPLTESTPENTSDIPENSHTEKYTDTQRQALNRLGKVIANSGNIGHIQTAEELRTIVLLGADIANITETDILAVDLGELRALAGLTIRLSDKSDIADKLTLAEPWWYANDWRGKQGQPPTVKQLGSVWGQFEAAQDTSVNGTAYTGPPLTDEMKKRLAELTARDAQK